MRKLWKFAVTAGAALSAVALVTAPAASAAGTIPGYGWDGNAHVIVGAGSETTYYAMNSINRIYQESSNSGCLHNTGTNNVQNSCLSDQPNNLLNYQGDTVAQANPVGSGGGIGALNGNGGAAATMQGTVNPILNPSRNDSADTTNGSATVADATATTADIGKSVTGPGIPVSLYAGPATTAGSIHLSSAPDQQLDVAATATATGVSIKLQTYDCVNATTGANPDYARSSRPANTTGGSTPCGNELTADTFWGYGQDGNEVFGFNNHGNMLNTLAAPSLTGQTVFNIWNCTGGTGSTVGADRTDGAAAVTSGSATVTDAAITTADVGHGVTGTGIPANTFVGAVNATAHTFKLSSSATSQVDVLATTNGTGVVVKASQRMRWSDVIPGLAGGAGGPNDADIVPWGMNTGSGTFGTFNTWVIGNSNAPAGWTMDGQACDRKLQPDNVFPLENDIKPLINDGSSQPLSNVATSPNNPENWMWQGSFANLSTFQFLSQAVNNGTTYTAIQARINGTLAGFANILDRSWPIARTIFHVTRKADADCVKTAGACDFVGHPGPALAAGGNDLNVTGATSGTRGAVRELTRAMCRLTAAQQGTDPYTGVNFNTGLTSAINGAGFTIIKATSRTPGSRCQVIS